MIRGLARVSSSPVAATLLFAAGVAIVFLLLAEASRDRQGEFIDAYASPAVFEKALPEIRFDDAPWLDVTTFLTDVTGVEIRHTEAAREIAKSRTCSTRMRNVKFRKVLITLIESVNGGVTGDGSSLGWTVEGDGALLIATHDELNARRFQRDYPVGYLLKWAPITLPNGEPTREELILQLTSLIRETIGVGTWHADGGTLGTMESDIDRCIVRVVHTPAIHAQIERLLEKLVENRERGAPPGRPWAAGRR